MQNLSKWLIILLTLRVLGGLSGGPQRQSLLDKFLALVLGYGTTMYTNAFLLSFRTY